MLQFLIFFFFQVRNLNYILQRPGLPTKHQYQMGCWAWKKHFYRFSSCYVVSAVWALSKPCSGVASTYIIWCKFKCCIDPSLLLKDARRNIGFRGAGFKLSFSATSERGGERGSGIIFYLSQFIWEQRHYRHRKILRQTLLQKSVLSILFV